MCSPTLAISAASAAFGFVSQQQAANRQEAALRQSQRLAYEDMTERQEQIRDRAAARSVDIAREAMQRQARIRVAAGEAGLAGLVVQNLLQDDYAQTGMAVGRNSLNARNALEQSEREIAGLNARYNSRVNAIDRPSIISTGLQIAGDTANEFAEAPAAVELNAEAPTASIVFEETLPTNPFGGS